VADSLGAAFLGILQGLTEFLPVSSSGHLVLFQQFVDIGDDHVLFDLVLHLGTLIPVLWFYRGEVARILLDPVQGEGPMLQRHGVRTGLLVVLASIPTGIIGLAFEDLFEAMFSAPATLTLTFAITGTLLFFAGRADTGEPRRLLDWKSALLLGVAQGLAITPGISRSGTTISIALMLGIEREAAARFSFLLSVPAIVGAVLVKLKDVGDADLAVSQLLIGGTAAMVTGYFALVLLVKMVLRGTFSRWCWYCWGAAIVAGLMAGLG